VSDAAGCRRIGIFGGTFDPVHHGHLRTAVEVCDSLRLDELRLMPSNLPPHRAQAAASAQQRLEMLRLALQGSPGLIADDHELRRGGVSYSIDTLRALRAELGSETRLALLIGMDAFLVIDSWREWRRLLDHAHLVVLARPGSATQLPAAIAAWAVDHAVADAEEAFARAPCGSIVRLELTQLAISATHIRQLIATGCSPRFLLPDVVLEFIRRHTIYQGAGVREGVND